MQNPHHLNTNVPSVNSLGINSPSVNLLSQPLVDALIADAVALKLAVMQHTTGATMIDAGINVEGSLEAGRRIAEICMGGLGAVRLKASTIHFPLFLENKPLSDL